MKNKQTYAGSNYLNQMPVHWVEAVCSKTTQETGLQSILQKRLQPDAQTFF